MRLATLVAAASLAAASLPGASASAQQITLRLEPGSLAEPARVEALYAEIEAAATAVCRRAHRATSAEIGRARRLAIEACIVDAIDLAVRDAGLPALQRLHAGRVAPDDERVEVAAAQ